MAFTHRVVLRTRQIASPHAGSLAFTYAFSDRSARPVALEFAARFPVFEQWLTALEAFLLKHIAARERECGGEHAHSRVHHEGRRYGRVSILFIVATATMLIATVEREINILWGVRAALDAPTAPRLRDGRDARSGARGSQHFRLDLA
jgi:hypothetical protein